MAFWFAPVGAAIGGAVGKVLGKVAEWVPSPEQHYRDKIKALQKERDEIINSGIPSGKSVRLARVLEELERCQDKLANR